MRHQIAQDGKRLGRQQNALVLGCLLEAPETLIAGVQPEWGKVLHRHLRQCWSVVRHGRGPDRPRARAVLVSPLRRGPEAKDSTNCFVTLS